jgi:hypothetical protein
MVVVEQKDNKVTYQCRKCGDYRGYDVEYVVEQEQAEEVEET